MRVAGDDDRRLAIAEGDDLLHGFVIRGQVDQLVADALGAGSHQDRHRLALSFGTQSHDLRHREPLKYRSQR